MALDWSKAQGQLQKLERAGHEAGELKRRLAAYRRQLDRAWSAGEITYFDRTIDELSVRCEQLERDVEALSKDMERAMEDIRAEEAREEAAAQPTEG